MSEAPSLKPLPTDADVARAHKTVQFLVIMGIVLMVVMCSCIVGVFLASKQIAKDSELYQLVVEELQTNPQVIQSLGEPIEIGDWPYGMEDLASGQADLLLNATGPRNTAKIQARGAKLNPTTGELDPETGEWTITYLLFLPENADQLELIKREHPLPNFEEEEEEEEEAITE